MTPKEYLSRIRLHEIKVKNKLRQIEYLKDMSTSLRGVEIKERVQTSQITGDTIGIAIGNISELEKELGKDVQELIRIKQQVMQTIDKVTNADCVYLLYARYLEFKTWEEIAVDMHYNIRNIYRIHGRALEEISKIKDVTKCHTEVC